MEPQGRQMRRYAPVRVYPYVRKYLGTESSFAGCLLLHHHESQVRLAPLFHVRRRPMKMGTILSLSLKLFLVAIWIKAQSTVAGVKRELLYASQI